MKRQIKNYFGRYAELSDIEIDEIYDHLILKTFNKNEYLLEEGQICKSKFFITKGLTRSYYIDDKVNDQILQFGIENWWVTNLGSFIKEIPSYYAIQAIENTTVLSINKNSLEELYISIPKLERIFRIITENMLIAIQYRNDQIMKMNSKDRYNILLEKLPDFVQRIPQYMIASYLEITPEYLSYLRKN